MHYSKVVLITLFASATTIGAIGPAQYGANRARAYHDRLNARDPVADAYADPYDEEGVYARAPNADAYADPFDEEGIYARDPVADADADAYDEGEIDARDAFGAEYHAHALDARAPPGSTYPRTKSPSRQGTGAKNQHPGTPKTPAAQGDLHPSSVDEGYCNPHSIAQQNKLVCDTVYGTCLSCAGKKEGDKCWCKKSEYV